MTPLEGKLSDVSRHIDYDDRADIPSDVYDMFTMLVAASDEQAAGLQSVRELVAMGVPASAPAGMTRAVPDGGGRVGKYGDDVEEPYAHSGLVLMPVRDFSGPTSWLHTTLSVDEARLLGLRLIKMADEAEAQG